MKIFKLAELGTIKKSFKILAADPKDDEDQPAEPEESEEDPADAEEAIDAGPETEEEPVEDEDEIEEEEEEEEEADISDILSAIKEAAKKQLLLKVTYRDRDGNITEGRYIEPWEVRDQYLFAGDNYGDPSTSGETGTKQFIMATFSDWELSEEPYQNPAGYPIKIK